MTRVALALAALALAAACSSPAPAPAAPNSAAERAAWCPSSQGYFSPGCRTPTLARAACYTPCSLTAPCGEGFRCLQVNVACEPGGGAAAETCDVCGVDVDLCIPTLDGDAAGGAGALPPGR